MENPTQLNKDIQKTDLPKKEKSNTDLSNTDSIPIHSLNPLPYDGEAATPPEWKRKEATDAYSVYEEIIKDNIEYDHFVRYGQVDKDRLDEIVSIILETVCSKRKTIRIAGDDYPAELVKAKFMKLNSSHIEFVFDCMKENTTKIRNIKQYLKAVLFNAPNTIDSYYTALVNHDMYGGTIQSARKKGIPDYSYNEGESLYTPQPQGGFFMAQKTGALIFDEQTDRYDIRFDIADYYGGLHCGECFDVFTGGKWKPTRIEMSAAQEWYLVGVRAHDLNGLRVRI